MNSAPEKLAATFAEKINCASDDRQKMVDCMKKADLKTILETNSRYFVSRVYNNNFFC